MPPIGLADDRAIGGAGGNPVQIVREQRDRVPHGGTGDHIPPAPFPPSPSVILTVWANAVRATITRREPSSPAVGGVGVIAAALDLAIACTPSATEIASFAVFTESSSRRSRDGLLARSVISRHRS